MAKLVNLTPHAINVVGEDVSVLANIPPSGQVARVSTRDTPVTSVTGIPVSRQEYGDVEGLPAPRPGVFLVVSGLVRAACPDRADVLSPGQLVRDAAGRPIGCRGFVCN